MGKHRYIIVIATIVMISVMGGCKHKSTESAPIDEPTMINLLHDAYLIEGYYTVETGYRFDTLHAQMAASYDSLFAQYNISKSDFDTCIAWYVRHYEAYQRVVDSVSARLTREAELVRNEVNSSPQPEHDLPKRETEHESPSGEIPTEIFI